MSWKRYIALIAALLVVSCVKTTTKPPAPVGAETGIVLKYKFPKGRNLKYVTTSEMRMTFSMPYINAPQTVKTVSTMNITEQVIQEPIEGYALVEQRVEGLRMIFYQGEQVIFDTSRPDDFPAQPGFEGLGQMQQVRVRYEISESGAIRRSEGLEEAMNVAAPSNVSQIFQSAQPELPPGNVSPGQSWKSRREISLAPGKGMTGALVLDDTMKLIEVRQEGDSKLAVIELNRNISIIFKMPDSKTHKLVPVMKGRGDSISNITLDLERGVVVKSDGRMKIETSTAVTDQPAMNQFTLAIEGTVSSVIAK